ncbi:DnaA ATPase domain-containing protein [Oceanibium sediminis]|uniref:DnaA ATPase domain-containing protein n=1 Tax=Oceanibium sediminis TaxID=2026339 RepID=UPI000DD3BE2F|nr:DnaA/Hda family protein [Oceanibium sediminis]
MARQLSLDLGSRPALGREAFLVSDANATALAAIEAYADWPGGRMALVGPEGAGKTHLAHVWAEMSGAQIRAADDPDLGLPEGPLVLEDVDRIAGDRAAEERVFHAHNAVINAGHRLLVTARSAPPRWGLSLPDLASRMQAAGVTRLEAPDDALLAGVLVKLFADRQLRVSPSMVAYILRRIDRSFAAAADIVARIDRAAMAGARPVGLKLAIDVLAENTGA